MRAWRLTALAVLGACSSTALAAPLRIAVTAENHMPLAEIRKGELVGGLLKDIGDEIARRLGREPVYLVLPSKRLDAAMAAGEADITCNQRPEWRSTPLIWTRPLYRDRGWLIARPGAEPVRRMEDLAGKRVGMVQGYVYSDPSPQVQARLIRDDAPSMRANIEKFDRGHVSYAFVNEMTFLYLQRRMGRTIPTQPPLRQPVFEPACGISPKSAVPADRLRDAVDTLAASTRLTALLDRYR